MCLSMFIPKKGGRAESKWKPQAVKDAKLIPASPKGRQTSLPVDVCDGLSHGARVVQVV